MIGYYLDVEVHGKRYRITDPETIKKILPLLELQRSYRNRTSKVKKKIKCCVCGSSMVDSKINMMCLLKEAKWKIPTWGNALLGIPPSFAAAIICDKCFKEKKKPKWAVEWDQKMKIAKYHPVEELKDVPPEIFEPLDMLEPGRHRLAG